jgi:hypothetical protein
LDKDFDVTSVFHWLAIQEYQNQERRVLSTLGLNNSERKKKRRRRFVCPKRTHINGDRGTKGKNIEFS